MERLTVDQRQAAASAVLRCLQAAFYADPSGMVALANNRVPMNQALAEHPHIQPGESVRVPSYMAATEIDVTDVRSLTTRPLIGLVGILNSMLSPLDIPPMAMLYMERQPDTAYEEASPDDEICMGFGGCVDPESKHAANLARRAEEALAEGEDIIASDEVPSAPPWTQEQKDDAFRRVLALFQSCFEADPGAIYTLISNRVTTTTQIVEHEFIICEPLPIPGDDPQPMLGVLGVLNGVLGCLGLPLLASRWDDCENNFGQRRMLGFQRFNAPAAST